MTAKRGVRGRRKRRRSGSRVTTWAAVLLLFFVFAFMELVPLLLQGLGRGFALDTDEVIAQWPLHPGYWVAVLVFAAPLIAATVFATATGFLARGREQSTPVTRWSGIVLGLAVAYSVAVQWATLAGTTRPQLSRRLEDLPLGVADVLRVAAYPGLVVLLGTFTAVVVVGLLTRRDRPQLYAWWYLAVAVVVVLLVGWLNGNRYF
ncbi:hypothetical protein [uncultured Aeromicrobium sp.]|uniref:hypothetical protein n=1 Tax=uncultured Aeromicrobium sp. TaxID=337820 RepID=UPI0025F263D7|nr:hypothetical protein [uncultured Aeromicrobium sp.]